MVVSKTLLHELGLSGAEASVYLALLALGSAKAREVTVRVGMYPANAYDALDRLVKRGLVSYVMVNGSKVYQAAAPERLRLLVERSRAELAEKEAALATAMPEFESLRRSGGEGNKVSVFYGVDGMQNILEEIVATGKEWLIIGSTGKSKPALGEWVNLFERRRIRRGVKMKILSNREPLALKRAAEFSRMRLTQVRYLPPKYAPPATIYVYGDKTVILVWSGEESMGAVFDDSAVSAGFRSFFWLLWGMSSPKPG